jgi:hypothetical protein
MKEETVPSNGSSQANVVNIGNRVLKLGLDMHYRQVTVAMQEDGGRIKAAGKMRHADFLNLAIVNKEEKTGAKAVLAVTGVLEKSRSRSLAQVSLLDANFANFSGLSAREAA